MVNFPFKFKLYPSGDKTVVIVTSDRIRFIERQTKEELKDLGFEIKFSKGEHLEMSMATAKPIKEVLEEMQLIFHRQFESWKNKKQELDEVQSLLNNQDTTDTYSFFS